MEELNQTLETGLDSIALSIENLRFPIENNSPGCENTILLIILIFVLICINRNIKKLVDAKKDDK